MNIALSNRHSVHMAHATSVLIPACESPTWVEGVPFRHSVTERAMTCRKCIRLEAAEAEREAAYQARLAASMSPATEGHDLGYTGAESYADREASQPAEVRNVREAAEDAACNARRDAAVARATLKLTAPKTTPSAAELDAAHAEALAIEGDPFDLPDPDGSDFSGLFVRRGLVVVSDLCTCGHGKHLAGACFGHTECPCTSYVASGLESVFDRESQVWGIRPAGAVHSITWLPHLPTRGGVARDGRAALTRLMAHLNA